MSDARFVARNAMMPPTHMSECRPFNAARPVASAARGLAVCDSFLVGLVAITLVRAGEALAGEQASETGAVGKLEPSDAHQSTMLPAYLFDAPGKYSMPGMPETSASSREEFRPRGHSIFESDAHTELGEEKLISNTTVWQRLSEFRAHDRVRVLTLWESGLSSVSLQAGKKGNPSLQWTSRMMNSGEAAHGLLDRLLPAASSAARGASDGAAGVAHPMAHSASPQPGARGEPAGKGAASFGAARLGPP
jgi:hypothetical protein